MVCTVTLARRRESNDGGHPCLQGGTLLFAGSSWDFTTWTGAHGQVPIRSVPLHRPAAQKPPLLCPGELPTLFVPQQQRSCFINVTNDLSSSTVPGAASAPRNLEVNEWRSAPLPKAFDARSVSVERAFFVQSLLVTHSQPN